MLSETRDKIIDTITDNYDRASFAMELFKMSVSISVRVILFVWKLKSDKRRSELGEKKENEEDFMSGR